MLERKNNQELHSWVEERLSAYMDNQLPSLERARVDRHLRGCDECQRALASLQWTVALLKQAPAPALPRSFLLPVPERARRAPIIGLGVLRFGTAMATLLLISLIGIDLILQYGSFGMTATSSAPRIAASQAKGPQTAAPPTQAASQGANAEMAHDGLSAATTSPMLKGITGSTQVPPAVAPLPAAQPATAPPTVAPKPTSPPASTSAPAATAAPFAGALQFQTRAPTRPPVRSSVAQASSTPASLSEQGRGGGNGKSSQDSTAATAAPLEPQPRLFAVEPTATPSGTPTEIPSPATAALAVTSSPPAATAAPTREALVRPTSIPATPPPVGHATEYGSPISPLRIAELGVLFVAVFLGVLTLLLRR